MLIFLVAEFSLAHFKAIFGHIGALESFVELYKPFRLEGSEKIGYGKLWSNLGGHF